jgi:hypothetical protein
LTAKRLIRPRRYTYAYPAPSKMPWAATPKAEALGEDAGLRMGARENFAGCCSPDRWSQPAKSGQKATPSPWRNR